jgi:serine/threonine-protein kinase RsbW
MDPLIVPGTLNSLQAVEEYVAKAAAAAGLDDKASYRLQLAVDEITTNVIAHGYADREVKGELRLQADIDEQTLAISIEDDGAT